MAEFRFSDLIGVGVDMVEVALFYDRLVASTDDTLRFRDGDRSISYSGEFSTRRGEMGGTIEAARVKLDGATLLDVTDLDVDASAFLQRVADGNRAGALRLLTAADDAISGTRFADLLVGGSGNDLVRGRGGKDWLEGGSGSDMLLGGSGKDRLDGGSGKDNLKGGGGDDRLIGGAGRDRLEGGAGRDVMIGGDGDDRFVFADRFDFASRETPDVIRDFERGADHVVLAALDANTLAGGEQAFEFIGRAGFSGAAGELRFKHGILSGDVQGDGRADFFIAIEDVERMNSGDFIL